MKNLQGPIFRTGIGRTSFRFLPQDSAKLCVIGGIIFEGTPGFQDASDGDVVFHAMCQAITSLIGTNVLDIAENLRIHEGIIDSEVYLKKGLELLGTQQIVHMAISLEAKKPRFKDRFTKMRSHIAKVLTIDKSQVGITATSGHGLSDVGCGDGVDCMVIMTTREG